MNIPLNAILSLLDPLLVLNFAERSNEILKGRSGSKAREKSAKGRTRRGLNQRI
jgi:hypothetical protein